MSKFDFKKYFIVIRRLAYWVLPIAILSVVFSKIDYHVLWKNLHQMNFIIFMGGIICRPLVMVLGGFRWGLLLRPYINRKIEYNHCIKHYWIGQAIGMFLPGSIGWDVYRVMAIGRKFDEYLFNMAGIIVEKFLSLMTCTLIIIILYPVMIFKNSPPFFENIISAVYISFVVSMCLIIFMIFLQKNGLSKSIIKKIEKYFLTVLRKPFETHHIDFNLKSMNVSLEKIVQPISSPVYLFTIIVISLFIQIISAIGSQIFFISVGYELSFLVNLFVTPIFYFLFVLPISFNGLGVRELAYIFMFGLFGVPPETALIISFCSLLGLLLNNCIGATIMFFQRDKRGSKLNG